MTRLSACLLFLLALGALGIRTPCWADDAIERERMIREREQEIIGQKETGREARKAAEVRKEKDAARHREREDATARQRELERNTRASIDSVVVELARKLAGAAPILVVQMGADAAILQGGQDIGMSRGERLRCFH